MMWSMFASLSYLYMVASWGGYAFIINIIPILVVISFLENGNETQFVQ